MLNSVVRPGPDEGGVYLALQAKLTLVAMRLKAGQSRGLLRRMLVRSLLTLIVGATLCDFRASGQQLAVSFGNAGLERVVYGNAVIEDVGRYPADALHIWHMRMTDLGGHVQKGGQTDWGENNSGKSWDATSHAWTYSFSWGSIRVGYQVDGDALLVDVTETNRADSQLILEGASVFPVALHVSGPVPMPGSGPFEVSDNVSGPAVNWFDLGAGAAAVLNTNASRPLYSGAEGDASGDQWSVLVSSTPPDGLATFSPHVSRPVMPGGTDHMRIAIRFVSKQATAANFAGDVFRNWALQWPQKLHWSDRRILGTVYLASSPGGDPTQPQGYPNNPRRYFNESDASSFDVRTQAGMAAFQQRILNQAADVVNNLRRMNGQGAITWDIEGEEYPQATSYVCAPDQISSLAPEMESVVGGGSVYSGMKLVDAYFRTIRDAGFRVGVCVRPQRFVRQSSGSASQVTMSATEAANELMRKMKYAHDRWGATLFYADSMVDENGAALSAALVEKVAAQLPDSLLIPEEWTTRTYAYSAPFQSFLFHGSTGTDSVARAVYPKGFSAILINDVSPAKLAAARDALTGSMRSGDVPMLHADYWQVNNDTVMDMLKAAHAASMH